MYVINKRAGIMHLYNSSKIKRTFQPGKNEISPADWASIVKANPGQNDNPSVIDVFFEVVAPKESIDDGVVVGEESIDFARLGADAAIELAKSTATVEELDSYLRQENKGKKRTTVITAIRETKGKIEELLEKIEADKAAKVNN